jgi:hypothetical protein
MYEIKILRSNLASAELAHTVRAAYNNKFLVNLGFKDIAVLLFGDFFYVYWLEFLQVSSLEILKGSGGQPYKGRHNKKKSWKRKKTLELVKVDFLKNVIYSIWSHFGCSFWKYHLKTNEKYARDSFRPFFAEAVFFQGNLGRMWNLYHYFY